MTEWDKKLIAVRNGRSFGLKTLRMDQVDNSVWGDKRIYTDGFVWEISLDGWCLSEEAQMIYDKLSEEKHGERKVVEYDLDWEI